MKCPFMKKKEVSRWQDGLTKKVRAEEYFMDCYKEECPFYWYDRGNLTEECRFYTNEVKRR